LVSIQDQLCGSGQNSANIDKWFIDNISVTRQCRPPEPFLLRGGGDAHMMGKPAVFTSPGIHLTVRTSIQLPLFLMMEPMSSIYIHQPQDTGKLFPGSFISPAYLSSIDVYCQVGSGTYLSLCILIVQGR